MGKPKEKRQKKAKGNGKRIETKTQRKHGKRKNNRYNAIGEMQKK
jgi:hypothetical protein